MPAPQSHAIQTRSPSTPVQLAAAAVLLQEGVKGGEQLGHRGELLDHLVRPQ